MMVAHYLVALILAAGEPTCAGAVTSCEGPTRLLRDGQHFRLVHGASVEIGDEIICGEGARAAIYLTEGQSVMLAAGTRVLYESPTSLRVLQGEARVTCDGWPRFEIHAGNESMHLDRGIARVRVAVGQSSWQLDHGEGLLHSINGKNRMAPVGEAATHSNRRSSEWTIIPSVYQRAAVQQAAPRIEPPEDLQSQLPDPAADRNQPGEIALEDEEDREPLPDADAPEPTVSTPPEAPEVGRGPADDGRRDLDAGNTVSSSTFGSISSFSLGSFSGSNVSFGSAGLFADANQSTLEGSLTVPFDGLDVGDPFPGNIHLVAAENAYEFTGVQLTAGELGSLFPAASFPDNEKYFSIGLGAPPSNQVVTNVATGTDPTPTIVDIPRFDGYLVRLDQYGIPDPATEPADAAASNFGITGLLGTDPASPTIVGATPLLDERAAFNEQATFALGEFRVAQVNNDGISFGIRRGDQDRTIVKDPNFNDSEDLVTPNPQVSEFNDVPDPRFQPAAPTVKVPAVGAFDGNPNRFRNLDTLRRAAVTTLVADQLYDYSRRTGQTRFVVDGRIIDISGFRR